MAPEPPRPRLSERRRVALVLAVTAAVGLPIYWSGWEPAALRPLAVANAYAVEAILDAAGGSVERDGTVLRRSSDFAIEVTLHCTAWIFVALCAGACLASSGNLGRRLERALSGAALILAVNLLRLSVLAAVAPSDPFGFELVHRGIGEAVLVLAGSAAIARRGRELSASAEPEDRSPWVRFRLPVRSGF